MAARHKISIKSQVCSIYSQHRAAGPPGPRTCVAPAARPLWPGRPSCPVALREAPHAPFPRVRSPERSEQGLSRSRRCRSSQRFPFRPGAPSAAPWASSGSEDPRELRCLGPVSLKALTLRYATLKGAFLLLGFPFLLSGHGRALLP